MRLLRPGEAVGGFTIVGRCGRHVWPCGKSLAIYLVVDAGGEERRLRSDQMRTRRLPAFVSGATRVGARELDITGQRYGSLVAVAPDGKTKQGVAWACRCDCGGSISVHVNVLRAGRRRFCNAVSRAHLRGRTVGVADGIPLSISDVAFMVGCSHNLVRLRVREGMSVPQILLRGKPRRGPVASILDHDEAAE